MTKALNVLVADDNPQVTELFKNFLERRGHSVVLTSNGEECLLEFKKHYENKTNQYKPFDVIILDQKMPSISGSHVAKVIVALIPNQKIVFSTAYPDELQKNIVDFPGTFRYFPKFASLDKFYTAVEA